MPDKNKTLYEVLGVKPDAKMTDIGRAYNRIRADLEKEHAAPNPRFAALAKVAFETLSDPQRREEYDESLREPVKVRSKRGVIALAAGVGVLIAAAVGASLFVKPRGPAVPVEKVVTPEELVENVGNRVGRLRSALMSGEVHDLGAAVSIGENEMVTTCRGFVAGATLSVLTGGVTSKADPGRVNEDLDICTLVVKRSGAGIRIRGALPAPNEKLRAIVVGASGLAQAREVTAVKLIDDPKGKLIELKSAAPLENGTPLFDTQGRLAGLVVVPSPAGEGHVVALPGSRIVQARGAEIPAAQVAASTGASAPADTAPAPAAVPAPESSPAPQRRGVRGAMQDDGFTTLWKEDEEGRLVEVLDSVQKGQVGNPLAYWTRWTGRDEQNSHIVHCRVTGPGGREVRDYDENAVEHPAGGYWYCAIVAEYLDNLDNMPEGEYQFAISVDGQDVAQKSIRLEKRFFTRGTWAVIVVVIGMLLFAFGRRNKIVSYADAPDKR